MVRALVIGMGESGLAMARWLAREGWDLRCADTRGEPPMLGALRDALPEAEVATAALSPALLEGIGLVALSPGLAPRHEPLRGLLAAARDIETVGEIELFARALARLREERAYAPRVVGVTGTNGKTTTVRMTGAMIAASGRSVRVAGNVSPSALDALRAALDEAQLPDYWVLELSSFQLATTRTLACTAAALLNVTEDHLDWHESFDDYRACKLRIFGASTARILNRDDPALAGLLAASPGAETFGAGAPDRPGQFGLLRQGGIDWLSCTDEAPAPRRRRRGRDEAPAATAEVPAGAVPAEDAALAVHRLMPVDALAVRGTHNALNALAALALARAVGVPLAPALRALGVFPGEAHRTQTVACIDGVEYVDDSKGTNVGATVAALRGLAGAPDSARRIVVILGGDGKGQSFAPLADAARETVRAALLIGRDGPAIGAALAPAGIPVQEAPDLASAVRAAASLARPGDIVLLSPACASFDAFRNYAHRAEVFLAAVRELEAAHSAPAGVSRGHLHLVAPGESR